MFFFDTFQEKDLFAIFPALSFEIMRCPDQDCQKIHGYTLSLKWLDIGIAAVLLLENDDLV